MGVVGLLVAMLINMFLHSGTMALADQRDWRPAVRRPHRLRHAADQEHVSAAPGSEFLGKAAIMGALSLYLDFINMFQFLLSFMGNRR